MMKSAGIMTEKLCAPAEEAYKVLRTNIRFCELDTKIKSLTITSYSPGEGKTATSVNLAVSMAQSGMKVLLVDADLRKPMLHKNPARSSIKGLSNYISGYAILDEIINSTDTPGLYYIASGAKPVNPAELIGSRRFDDFLKTVKEEYDMVIIDTPPLGSVIDCAIVAPKTDGTLIVIEPHRVKNRNARMLKEQLERAGARILGVVLNKVPGRDYKKAYRGYDYYGRRSRHLKGWFKRLRR